MPIKINPTRLNRAIDQAFRETAQAYAEQCQVEIQAPRWDWPGETKRRNGQTAGTQRDIVDEGELLESLQPLEFREDNGRITAILIWDAPHAAVAYTGLKDRQEVYPAREWGKAALESLDVAAMFRKKLREKLK